MEEESLRIKKKYVYTIFAVLILLLGFSIYSLVIMNDSTPEVRETATYDSDMASHHPEQNSAAPNQDSMAGHHGGVQGKSTGFFELAVAKQAPDFELQDINGNSFKLSDYRGKNVVLFFNEGSMCYPACWNQIAAFTNDARFNSDNTIVFSIVADSPAQWQKIIQQVPQFANSRILFDTNKKVSTDYDVLFLESSMHKGSFPGHTYVVIDKNGVIRYAKDDSNMGIGNEMIASELEKINGA